MEAQLKKWIAATGNPDKLFKWAVLDNETEVLDANTAQLSKGKDSMGAFLYDYLSDDYAKFKKALGSQAPLGTPNLYLEGDFYEGFVLRYNDSVFEITSTDEKRDKLVQMYGEDIFGLAQEQLPELAPLILESFQIAFRNQL